LPIRFISLLSHPRLLRHQAIVSLTGFLFVLLPLGAFAQSQDGFTYNGVVYTSYQANEYLQTPQGAQGTAAIRATGANYTSVVATQYMQTATSNTIAPETPTSPGYNGSYALTPTDSAVAAAIQNLQAQGLTVFLKPQVDSIDGTFRGSFAPASPAAWFASYQTFILHYAALASANGVGGLVIGTEFKSLSGSAYLSYWTSIISQIRTSYPSLTLTYAANATGAGDEFTTVSFWNQLDIIGVDGYFPLTNHADPTVAQLVAAWTNNKSGFNAVAALQSLQATYNKPLIFTEIGYVSAAGTNEAPYANAVASAPYDPTEQQNCYEAFFEVFSQQTAWMKGVFWWSWSVSPPGSSDEGYTPQSKPAAMATLPLWFGSTKQGFTLAPSSSTLNLGAGLSATDTIATTTQGGFAGAVTLAATGLPNGVTASFSPGTVAGTQVMTLAVGANASTGSATIVVTGTSGTLTSSASIALTINSVPSFAVAANASTLSVTQGNNVTDTIVVTSANGFGNNVTLAASGLPNGVTASFGTNPTTGSSILTLTANSTALTGPATISVTGTSGNLSSSARIAFTVTAAPGITLNASPATVTISRGSGASYTVMVAGAGGFTGAIALSGAVTSSPQGAQNIPTASFGITSTVNVTNAVGATALLSVSTTAATTALLAQPIHGPSRPEIASMAALASLLLFGFQTKRRRWLKMLVLPAFLFLLISGISGCNSASSGTGPASSGTTPGTYAVTIKAVSGSVTSSSTVIVIVQ